MSVWRCFLRLRALLGSGCVNRFGHMLVELLFDRVETFFGTGMQEPEIADFLKAFGQDML
jgi:hypothetical protein